MAQPYPCRLQWPRSRRRRPRPLHPLMKPDRTTEPCKFGRSEVVCFHVSKLTSPPPTVLPRTPGCTAAHMWPLGQTPRCRARGLHGVKRLARACRAALECPVVSRTHAGDREAELRRGSLEHALQCLRGGPLVSGDGAYSARPAGLWEGERKGMTVWACMSLSRGS
jgi:hypothetical protein